MPPRVIDALDSCVVEVSVFHLKRGEEEAKLFSSACVADSTSATSAPDDIITYPEKTSLPLVNVQAYAPSLRSKLSHLMVDEYQDTNTIQERILLLLAGGR